MNSVWCTACNKWCHQRCSGLRSVLGVNGFICPTCKNGKGIQEIGRQVRTAEGVLEEVKDFCNSSTGYGEAES